MRGTQGARLLYLVIIAQKGVRNRVDGGFLRQKRASSWFFASAGSGDAGSQDRDCEQDPDPCAVAVKGGVEVSNGQGGDGGSDEKNGGGASLHRSQAVPAIVVRPGDAVGDGPESEGGAEAEGIEQRESRGVHGSEKGRCANEEQKHQDGGVTNADLVEEPAGGEGAACSGEGQIAEGVSGIAGAESLCFEEGDLVKHGGGGYEGRNTEGEDQGPEAPGFPHPEL